MKLRTRKFLAGLLSLGLLLQAASPLSALAAEDISGAAQVAPVSSLIVRDGDSDNYATVKYTLNHYADGRVSWENGKKPFEGIDVKYDTATSTFVFTGTLSLPESEKPFVNLTCTDPKTDSIKLDGNGDNAVGAALTVGFPSQTRGAKNITIVTDSSSSAAIRGYACLDCYGNVVIENPSGKVTGGATRTAEGVLVYGNAQNVTVTGDDSRFIISGDFSVYSKGDVTLTNPSGAITESYIRVAESAGDVKIEGSSNGLAWLYGTTYDSTMIKAKTLTMKNNGGTVGKVVFTGADTTSAYRVAVGESESSNTQTALTDTTYSATVDAKYLNIQTGTPENTTVKHTLTLTNAKAYTDDTYQTPLEPITEGGNKYSVEKGTKVYVVAEAPDNVSRWKFTGWEGSSETSENITVTVNENTTLTANWVEETPEPDEEVNYGITVTMADGTPIAVTSKNCGNILGDDYIAGKLTYAPDTHTLTGTGSFGKMKVEITDDLEDKVDVVLSNANGAVVNGSLTVTGAQDVEVTGTSSSALIDGKTTISCAGDILMENTGTGNVIGTNIATNLAVNSARSVTIKNVGTEGNRSYAIYGRADITCSGNGNVEIVSSNGMAIWDPIVVKDAKDVKIKAAGRAIWDERHDSTIMTKIECSGKVEITSDTAAALHAGNLIIKGATDVTISGNRDDGATIGGDAEIICSGPVVLENTGSGNAVSGVLKYTPDPSTKPYEIKAGENAEDAASKEPVATKEEGGTFSETVDASYISITAVGTPPVVPDDDDFTGGGSGAGGAVAAVIVGGAAVWGGYEIATRVILHNILPEGAEIPANRGQLALLVWNTAGRPEPVNTPAFADVADADTAKAAQWCVEQGIMDAKSESSFKPEGWMPKFKTIEVWEKAFPKQ